MKFLAVAIFILFCTTAPAISDSQNLNNLTYLDELDQKLISTIDLIVAFNNSTQNIIDLVEGADMLNTFFMDYPLDVSALRTLIEDSRILDSQSREYAIREIFSQINPQTLEVIEDIDPLQDKENQLYLEKRIPRLQNQLNNFRDKIIKEESSIIENSRLTNNYISLHNRHFVYLLLYNFSLNHHLLSPVNRQFLVDLIVLIDINIYKQKL